MHAKSDEVIIVLKKNRFLALEVIDQSYDKQVHTVMDREFEHLGICSFLCRFP